MTLYLIAHKVRGEPAFDVAERFNCPCCNPSGAPVGEGCEECESSGNWWIIPTSGHRAYPYWHEKLNECLSMDYDIAEITRLMPPGHPDHYACNPSPPPPDRPKLTSLLGTLFSRTPTNFKRRV